MTVALKLSVSGFGLDDLDLKLANLADPISEIMEQQLLDAQHSVEVQKGFWGEQWPDMAKATIRSGRDPSTLLVDSGRLVESLQRGAAENIFEVGASSGIAGSSVPHARFQQEGSDRHPLRPPRPFLAWAEERIGPGPELEDPYREMFLRHLFGRR